MFGFGKASPPAVQDDGRIRARFLVKHPGFTLDVDLDLPGRGVSALFGHSGSGKTSCLRCFAGLDRPQQGYLQVAGELWQDSERGFFLPAHKRAIGYVFQDANLFPHLSVRKNLSTASGASPPRNARWRWIRRYSCWASATCSSACPRRCPAANASASASPARW